MKNPEILREVVSKGSPETQSEQGLLGVKKKAPEDLLNAGLPQVFNNLSRSEAKHNSLMYDCVGARSPRAADSTVGAGATESAVQEGFQNKGPVGPR